MNWDLLITAGSIIFIPSLLPTLFNKNAYIPKLTSVPTTIGLLIIVAGFIGLGLVTSPIITIITAILWGFIVLFRGNNEKRVS